MAATALLRLADFTNELRYADLAHQALTQMQPMIAQYPLGFGQWLHFSVYTPHARSSNWETNSSEK
jgi:uncharacterized protein YyaL (SSP411 family)